MESYREGLVACRGEFICVPDAYKPGLTEPPPLYVYDLGYYLEYNDCSTLPSSQYKECYARTRSLLIGTTEELDKANLDNYVLNRAIERLQNTINKMVDSFPKIEKLK